LTAPAFAKIVITGASSGIGAALASFYAATGVTLGLVGRDAVRLEAVASSIRTAGAEVAEGLFDLRNRPALAAFLTDFDTHHPIDLLIVNAGVLDGRRADGRLETAEAARRVIDINLLGAIDTVHAVLPRMIARGSGHIVLVSSLAALSPVTDAPAYSASKAGLLAYGKALRAALVETGVRVSVVCPGYVASAMTESHIGEQPGKISAAAAARLIAAGIARNKQVIGFPRSLYMLSMITPFVPEAINRVATKGIRFHVVPRGKESKNVLF
jgi:short-subunit dehydrogenase